LPDRAFLGNVPRMTQLNIIIPALDEAAIITGAPKALAPLRARGAAVIVVDGGGSDGTAALARAFAARVIIGPRSRGVGGTNGRLSARASTAAGKMVGKLFVSLAKPSLFFLYFFSRQLVTSGLTGRNYFIKAVNSLSPV
jgi:glycosyltransferase involved in cell wall biosynthesis